MAAGDDDGWGYSGESCAVGDVWSVDWSQSEGGVGEEGCEGNCEGIHFGEGGERGEEIGRSETMVAWEDGYLRGNGRDQVL